MGEVVSIIRAYMGRIDTYKRRGDTVRALYTNGVMARIGESKTWMTSAYIAAIRPSDYHPAPWAKLVLYPSTYGVRAANGRIVANYLSSQQADELLKISKE